MVFFSIRQGYAPTGGLILATVGALSIIPNFLITGIAAITIGLLIVIWSIGFVHMPKGPLVFILLSILLFLVGGGFGQVPFLLWPGLYPPGLTNR